MYARLISHGRRRRNLAHHGRPQLDVRAETGLAARSGRTAPGGSARPRRHSESQNHRPDANLVTVVERGFRADRLVSHEGSVLALQVLDRGALRRDDNPRVPPRHGLRFDADAVLDVAAENRFADFERHSRPVFDQPAQARTVRRSWRGGERLGRSGRRAAFSSAPEPLSPSTLRHQPPYTTADESQGAANKS